MTTFRSSGIHQFGPEATDVRHVDHALARLWQQAGVQLHVAAANLLVVTEAAHLKRVRETLNALGAGDTGRQVIVLLEDNVSGRSTEVSLVGVQHNYLERVETGAQAGVLEQIASELLRPATLTHVWWACDQPPMPHVLGAVGRMADQLILDTTDLKTHAQVNCLISDLAWARTARWRELTAQLFDDPLAVAQLGHLETASITFCGADIRPARLYGAWLADRLGWPDLQRVHLKAQEADRERGDLSATELSGPAIRFCIRASGPLAQGEVVYGGHTRRFEVPLLPMTLAQGLKDLMCSPVRDEQFIRALGLLRRASVSQPVSPSLPVPPRAHGDLQASGDLETVRHVLVAVDSSPHARLALKVARAHYPNAHRRLVTVVDPRSLPLEQEGRAASAQAERRALDTLDRLARDEESRVAVTGEPAEALLRAARSYAADVLVIGTHGRRGLGRWVLGSVAEQVVRHASIPVLVVREADVPDELRTGNRADSVSGTQPR
ncbi:glucose-6-phosphate dehydrogenase assembly protein OpcA [Deinococcus ruber]|nr:glucose-6-phosphate dehydrogenase assembly protein OpcA [Deinococcus ruber]